MVAATVPPVTAVRSLAADASNPMVAYAGCALVGGPAQLREIGRAGRIVVAALLLLLLGVCSSWFLLRVEG